MSDELMDAIYGRLLAMCDSMNEIIGLIERSRGRKKIISVDKKTADIGKIIFDEEVLEG